MIVRAAYSEPMIAVIDTPLPVAVENTTYFCHTYSLTQQILNVWQALIAL